MLSPRRLSLAHHRASSVLIALVTTCALVAGACSDSDTTTSSAVVEADAASSGDAGSPGAEGDAGSLPNSSDPDEGASGGATSQEPTEDATDAEAAPDPGGEVDRGAGAESGRDEPVRSERDFSAIGPIVEAHIAENALNGAGVVVVDREEGIVHEQYWGDFGPDRISLIASSTKMITAGVLLHLDDAGLLDVDAPVADAVAWGSANPAVTPAQLVSNSSGLVGLLPDPTYAPYLCQYLPGGTLQECGEAIFTTTADDGDIAPPDTEFRYGGAQWQVAGAVAEAVSGRSWAELIDEIYVEPCGLETLAYNNHFGQLATGFAYPDAFGGDPAVLAPTDNPNMEGGAYLAPGDYATLLQMILNEGRCGDVQVLSPGAVEAMLADRIGEVYEGSTFTGTGYGLGWWVDRERGYRTDPGAYGSVPWLDIEDGYGVYLVVEATSAVGNALAERLYAPVDDAMTAS